MAVPRLASYLPAHDEVDDSAFSLRLGIPGGEQPFAGSEGLTSLPLQRFAAQGVRQRLPRPVPTGPPDFTRAEVSTSSSLQPQPQYKCPSPYLPLPPGFRFRPTDAELLGHYLVRKAKGTLTSAEARLIPTADLLSQEPWDLVSSFSTLHSLPGSSAIGPTVKAEPEDGGGPDATALLDDAAYECYAFWSKDLKYTQGTRANRCTRAGYWKSTGSDRSVEARGMKLGIKKTLVFYLGRAPSGEKTDWVMHEFRLDESQTGGRDTHTVVCKVFNRKKAGNLGVPSSANDA